MQHLVDVKYEQILNVIKNLPLGQLEKIKTELDNAIQKSKEIPLKTEFQQFLLNGPVMSDEQYAIFLENRESFNQWRSK